MRKKFYIKWLLVVLPILLLMSPIVAFANGGDSEKSASVKTEGAITFETVDSTTEPTTEPTSDSSTTATTESSSLPQTGGKLPKTGELVTQGITVGGICLLLLAVFFFFWRKRKEEQRGNKGGMNK